MALIIRIMIVDDVASVGHPAVFLVLVGILAIGMVAAAGYLAEFLLRQLFQPLRSGLGFRLQDLLLVLVLLLLMD